MNGYSTSIGTIDRNRVANLMRSTVTGISARSRKATSASEKRPSRASASASPAKITISRSITCSG